MMTMRRFLLKREVAAISDWEFGKNKRKRKKEVCGCVLLRPLVGWMFKRRHGRLDDFRLPLPLPLLLPLTLP